MSIQYGLQSVVFYVLSCSTCAKFNHRRKARKVAEKERTQKEALEMEQPGLYHHPSPFNTNPYWNEEIMLGPGPPKRKGDKGASKNASTRALTTAGTESVTASDGGISTDAGSSPTMVEDDNRISGENWNRKRYQREDEELWGNELPKAGQRILDAFATAGSQVGSTFRAIEGRLSKSGPSKEESSSPYYVARNPPVNDLHPPIVSTAPTHKGATRWMLQPPPPAKVMEGKQRASRNRSGSGTSSRREVDGQNLSREVSRRAVETKLKRGEIASDIGSQNPSRPNSQQKFLGTEMSRGNGAEMERTPSAVDSLGGESSGSDKKSRRKRASPIFSSVVTSRKVSIDSIEDCSLHSDAPPASGQKLREVARPVLQPIQSSSIVVPKAETEDIPKNSGGLSSSPKKSSKLKSSTSLPPTTVDQIPTILPAVDSKFPGAPTFEFPTKESKENSMIVSVAGDVAAA